VLRYAFCVMCCMLDCMMLYMLHVGDVVLDCGCLCIVNVLYVVCAHACMFMVVLCICFRNLKFLQKLQNLERLTLVDDMYLDDDDLVVFPNFSKSMRKLTFLDLKFGFSPVSNFGSFARACVNLKEIHITDFGAYFLCVVLY